FELRSKGQRPSRAAGSERLIGRDDGRSRERRRAWLLVVRAVGIEEEIGIERAVLTGMRASSRRQRGRRGPLGEGSAGDGGVDGIAERERRAFDPAELVREGAIRVRWTWKDERRSDRRLLRDRMRRRRAEPEAGRPRNEKSPSLPLPPA